jgi:alpha-tubulin suppressor-like RCC1 family protein
MGSNQYGQLGIDDQSKIKPFPALVDLKKVKAIACGGNCSFALLEIG